jgi:putative transposase
MNQTCSQPDDLGVWRFGIISPLLHYVNDELPLHTQIRMLSEKTFVTPDGKQKKLCADTLRYWLDRYRAGGLDALRNKARIDQGETSVPVELQKVLAALREKNPGWKTIRLLRTMIKAGDWNGVKPSRCSMYRYVKKNGLNTVSVNKTTSVRSFEYPFFGDMWSSDFLHGPKVRNGVYMHKAYLCAIIDDATRYIVSAQFYLSEETGSLLDSFMLAIRRFGVPKRLYTDNGSAFRSKHLQTVAARLGISLPHTPPYTPQGRGKIERFFRTVREEFLEGLGTQTLDDLNVKFCKWINEYHCRPHSSLDMSPLNRKLTDNGEPLQQLPSTTNIDACFMLEHYCKIGPDGCVRLFKRRFEIPHSIVGTKVLVFYLPWVQDRIFVGEKKEPVTQIDKVRNALRFDKPQRGTATQSTSIQKENQS